jgi:hypothetical protein
MPHAAAAPAAPAPSDQWPFPKKSMALGKLKFMKKIFTYYQPKVLSK